MPSLTLDEVSRLSVTERLAVISEIWDTIVAEGDPLPVSEEMGAEFDRRLAEHAADPSAALDWSEIRDAQ
jgi:putative addiction module component (TIGR02574 family)